MRRLIGVLVVMAAMVVAAAIGDTAARHRVQTIVANQIEAKLPGSTAQVTISSSPFVGRLAASQTVKELTVRITGATIDRYSFASVLITVRDLKIDGAQLLNRRVVLRSIGSGTVDAVLTQQSVALVTGLPVVLGSGTVAVSGLAVTASASVVAGQVQIAMPGRPAISFALPRLSVLPCADAAVIRPGAVDLSCTLHRLPDVLTGMSLSF